MKTITLNGLAGIRVAVTDVGRGPALLFAHCLGGSRALWAPQLAHFGQAFRCVAYDLRGQGESTGTLGESSMRQLAEDAVHLLDTLSIEQCVFVGSSMGGMVAQHLAADFPDRVAGLVLADTAPGFDAAGRAAWAERIGLVRSEGLQPLVETMMGRWFSDGFRSAHPDRVAAVAEQLASTAPQGYAAACAAIRDHDFAARLSEIRCPTLVICGEDDPSTPLPLSQAIAAGIPAARLVVLPGLRHLPGVESPPLFNDVLAGFLAEIGHS